MLQLVVALALAVVLLGSAFWRQRDKRTHAERELVAARREMQALLALSKDLEVADDYAAILKAVDTAIRSIIGFSNSWIYLLRPDDPDIVDLLTVAGREASNSVPTCLSLHVRGDEMIEEIIGSRHPVVVHDARTDPRTNKEIVARLGNRTIVNVAMLMADRMIGSLGTGTFAEEGPRILRREEIAFLDAVGSRAAVALDRLRQLLIRRQEYEARLKLVKAMEFAEDSILVSDAKHIITYVNPAYERLFGISQKELQGKPISTCRSFSRDPERLDAAIETSARGQSWNGKLEMLVNGADIVVEANLSPVGEPGKINGYVCVLRDITTDERLSRAKDFFVNITAHEMRTPLTKLSLSYQLLQKLAAHTLLQTDEIEECTASLKGAYQSLNLISEATAMFTELSVPPLLALPPTSVAPLLAQCAAEADEAARAEERRITLARDSAAGEGLAVRMAPRHFMKAVHEALSNAIKNTPDGGVVTLRAYADEGRVVIETSDEGPGMTPMEEALLFTPFFAPENERTHSSGRYKFRGGGLGLGLSLEKLIAERYNGSVRLERRSGGVGMRNILTIPSAS